MTMRKNVVPTAGEAVPSTHDLLAQAYQAEALIRVCRLAVRDVHDGSSTPTNDALPAVECVLSMAAELVASLAKQIDRAGA
jgi:hypothetical protein